MISRYIAVFVFLASARALAETIVKTRLEAAPHLNKLKKITVGPEDQFGSAISPDGTKLVFAHKENLVAALKIQDLQSGKVSDLIQLTADSSEPAFSADGALAFTYYKFNARGDICWIKSTRNSIQDSDIQCVTRKDLKNTERLNPFWASSHELGFLERNLESLTAQIVAVDISSGATRVLAAGQIWSPNMISGGNWLVYNQLKTDGIGRGLVLKNLASGQTQNIEFHLPGMTGFPALSSDEKYIYFSHYLNDTNEDRIIDGSDNAVVFRVAIAQVLAPPPGGLVPEQLTSVETSCSFPKPQKTSLYVTCAFEGSLDVYQMPLEGQVPVAWTAALMQSALDSSRSYEDRVLLINAMETRLKTPPAIADRMLFVNHLLSKDAVAAKYYLGTTSFDQLLHIYLDGYERKRAEPSAEINSELIGDIMRLDQKTLKYNDQPRLQNMVRGLLRTFLSEHNEAVSFLAKVSLKGKVDPIERYFYFELAHSLYSMNNLKDRATLANVFLQMCSAPEFDEQEHIYYASRLLKDISGAEESKQIRIDLISAALANKAFHLPEYVQTLLQSEVISLKLILAKDPAAKGTVYRDLDKLLIKTKTDYFLRRALYVRAIVNFNDAAEFLYLDFIADNWLRYTVATDTEYSYAREVLADASFDRGYEVFAQNNFNMAQGYFYAAVTETDNLEAHSSYIRTMILKKDRKSVDTVYTNLQKRKFIEDNIKFVNAVLELDDHVGAKPDDLSSFDKAITLLTSMTSEHDSAMRYLVLGYCYLEKLLRTSHGLDFSSELFDEAHRNLMLAYDLGRDNDRIRASALMDLGILHQRTRNFGIAARFLSLRKKLGFTSPLERKTFAWIYADLLYHNHQPIDAAHEIHELGDLEVGPFIEREAFYLMAGEHYKEAAPLFARAIPIVKSADTINLAKLDMDLGISLFHTGDTSGAATAFNQSLHQLETLSTQPAKGERIFELSPERLRLKIYGYLGQIGSPHQRAAALEKRIEILHHSPKDFENASLLEAQAKVQLVAQDPKSPKAATWMNEALELTEKFSSENGFLSSGVFHSVADYLSFALEHPGTLNDSKVVNKMLEDCTQAYQTQIAAQNTQTGILVFEKLELEILGLAFHGQKSEIQKRLANYNGLRDDKAFWPRAESLAQALSR